MFSICMLFSWILEFSVTVKFKKKYGLVNSYLILCQKFMSYKMILESENKLKTSFLKFYVSYLHVN